MCPLRDRQEFISVDCVPPPPPHSGPQECPRANQVASKPAVTGEADRYDEFDSDLSQVRAFWEKTLNEQERARLADNIGGHAKDAQAFLQVGVFVTTSWVMGRTRWISY